MRGKSPVDQVRDPLLEAVQHRGRLSLGQATGGNGGIELLLRRRNERVDETVGRLPVVSSDLRKRLATLELGSELLIGQPEVARRTVQAGERAEVAEAVMEPDAEQREIAGVNPL